MALSRCDTNHIFIYFFQSTTSHESGTEKRGPIQEVFDPDDVVLHPEGLKNHEEGFLEFKVSAVYRHLQT
jgi:hypothetical protein